MKAKSEALADPIVVEVDIAGWTPSVKKQVGALEEFTRTLKRRPQRFCWRKDWPEPNAHREWRRYAYVLYRFRLWSRAGLPEFAGLRTMLRRVERLARSARLAWEEEVKRDNAEFLRSRTAAAEGLAHYNNEDE
jgi:hypothetical protein